MPTYIKGKYKCQECGALFSAPGTKNIETTKAGITAAFLQKEK